MFYSIDLAHILHTATSLSSFRSLLRADEGTVSDMRVSLQGPPNSSHFYGKEPDCLITLQKRKLKSPWGQRARMSSCTSEALVLTPSAAT